jgi:KDO2-lipid IV(A) lauroyltransferase
MTRDQLDARFAVDGYEHIEAARAAGGGAILAAAHLGNWDLAGAWIASRGVPLTAVAEPLDPPELFAWFVEQRHRAGLQIVPLGPGATTALVRALKDNHLVALLCDRDIGGSGVEVTFFGEVTTLPGGPATLALRTGAPLFPIGVYSDAGGRSHAVVRPPIDATRSAGIREDVRRVTQLVAHELEALIRPAPEEWHLFQPNWPSDREAR